MAHSLITTPATTIATPISTKSKKTTHTPSPSIRLNRVEVFDDKLLHRRNVTLGLAGAVLGLNIVVGDQNAYAAGRRPPPPPPTEKKDPSLSGVQAKVLASKKRKEAMKEAMAKLREKGNPVSE